jgi:hypothetical protein
MFLAKCSGTLGFFFTKIEVVVVRKSLDMVPLRITLHLLNILYRCYETVL